MQLIKLNPANYTKHLKNASDELDTAATKKIRVLTAKEAEQFTGACKDDSMGATLTFALATGTRPEEYLALRWSDVDFEHGKVRIQRVVQWHRKADGGFCFLHPKTRKSRRTLRASKSVLQVLQEHRRKQMLVRLKGGVHHPFATLALADGLDLKEASMIMEHPSAGFTMDTYQHVLPAMLSKASGRMGKILFKMKKEK